LTAYATVDQLADALEIRVTDDNTDALQDCLDAAATEIDHFMEGEPIDAPPQAIIVRTNVNRAVEWYKAPAAYAGGVGFVETGAMTAPQSGFERHSAALLPLKAHWGVA
jgi:hypothetical protein